MISPFPYPGAPFSISYLETQWEFGSKHCGDGLSEPSPWGDSGSWERWREGPCGDSQHSLRAGLQKYMSQKPHASDTAPSASRPSIPPISTGSDPLPDPPCSNARASQAVHETASHTDPVQVERLQMGFTHAPDQPRQFQVLSDQTSSRSLGVQSILNPSQPDATDDLSLEHRPGRGGSPQPGGSPVRPSQQPAPTLSPRILKRSGRVSSPIDMLSAVPSQGPRRVLTPKSPALRAMSLGPRRYPLPASPVTAQSSSIVGHGRVYTAEPGLYRDSDIPPLPLPTGVGRAAFTYPPQLDGALSQPRRASGGRGSLLISAPIITTQGDSPSTSHSSYSQFSQSSPVVRYGNALGSHSTSHHPSNRQSTNLLQNPLPGSNLIESSYEVGQGSYQMTLDTEQGPMIVPVEVDVQQASKMADEKRKRNAGASARFRARRKEKEKEASQTIDSLQKQIRDLTEEREFYLNERNFYRDYLGRTMRPAQLPLRPSSPQSRRLPLPSLPQTLPLETSSTQRSEPSTERTESPSRSQRRRTGDYQPSFARPPSASPMIHSQVPAYGPPFAMPHPASLQPSPLEARLPITSSQPPIPTRSTSYDPFRRDNYDRSWNPGR